MKSIEELNAIVAEFAVQGNVVDIKPLGNGLINDTLLVTYGRTAHFIQDIEGTDSLVLLKAFPICSEAADIAAGYEKVYFFEEGMKNGGIAEKFLYEIFERGFSGKYSVTAPEAPAAAADTDTQLAEAGLDREGIIRRVQNG